MREAVRAVSLVVACGVAVTLPATAAARTERETQYTYEQVWPTAVRHLRVDEGFTIVDKDPDAGYVVFEMKDDGKVFAGALEFVLHVEDGRKVVRLVLTITDRPDYMEASVLERLLSKLRQEHGDPPPPVKKKKPENHEDTKDTKKKK